MTVTTRSVKRHIRKIETGMNKTIYIVINLVVILYLMQQIVSAQPMSDRIVHYKMDVSLDRNEKTIDGTMDFSWKNPSNDTISELQFHLYLNAFKNTNSTFVKESGGQLRGVKMQSSDPLNWGWIDIVEMKTKDGTDLTPKIRYIQPDDDNEDDQSVISVALEEPVLPGDSANLDIKFVSKLPRIFARTGYSDDFYLVAQWFPKIGVYEPEGMRYAEKGQWNCHQFHANSEFYANFGVYEVTITLPKEFVVGATGELVNQNDNPDDTKTLTYLAEDVVDFAWTASPVYQVVEDQWEDVQIMVYLQPDHLPQADRHTESVKAALEYFREYLGKYPYSTISIIDPPLKGIRASGMEYPTFITAGCLWGIPDWIRFTEMVTIHEFGHNYFMAILASNEFEEAWIDEGFNSYFEMRIMDDTYGERHSFLGHDKFHFGDWESTRWSYVGSFNPKIAQPFRNAWEFQHGGYGTMSYKKTATWMATLDRLVGRLTMDEIMKTFYDRWKFKHPCGQDFINIVNEVVTKNHGTKFGETMDWYFEQVLYGSDICDYKLSSISNQRTTPPEGIHEEGGNKRTFKNIEYESTIYKSSVRIHRLGEVVMPVEVLVHFEDGEEILEQWDGKERSWEFKYEKPEKILWAKIDPEMKILIDVNTLNNSLVIKPKKAVFWKMALKFLFWLQNTMQSFSLLA